MAIPVHLQGFKAAGIYRVVFDKSAILNQDTNILRLVVGYSEVGPFNTPVYINNASDFIALFGGISKKLEKRGIYFHRLALQMLSVGPILALNLKKFENEHVGGSTISTAVNPKFEPIDTVTLRVEDIYDTSRFWTLDANKLVELRSIEGSVLDQYINIATTNTKKTSASYFIRKASGSKVSAYNVTVDAWYSDGVEVMPEYLEDQKQNKISDYFAEIYVFKGEFRPEQVLASETLKNYFNVKEVNGEKVVELKPYILDPYGDPIDTLDALYNDNTSGALGHYVGSLIPYFKDKQNNYVCLDVLFNTDLNVHNMMMAFNTDNLEEGLLSIDMSGNKFVHETDLENIFNGKHTTKLMSNIDSPVIASIVSYKVNVLKDGAAIKDLVTKANKINGTLYVSAITVNDIDGETDKKLITITLKQVASDSTVEFNFKTDADNEVENILNALSPFGITIPKDKDGKYLTDENGKYVYFEGDTYFEGKAFFDEEKGEYTSLNGPKKVITAISRVEKNEKDVNYTDLEGDFKLSLMDVEIETIAENNLSNNVYQPSMSFLAIAEDWSFADDVVTINGVTFPALYSESNNALSSVLSVGDILLAPDNTVKVPNVLGDMVEDEDEFCDNIFVEGTGIDDNGVHYVLVSAKPATYTYTHKEDNAKYLAKYDGVKYYVRMDRPINQEIGVMRPVYLEGYVYENDKPEGVGMYAKQQWQDFILSTLTDYKGLRVALLDKAEIDYRYVIDTFESYVTGSLKSVLSYLCKEKQSAFCIANFPSVQTFVKCPYASFTDEKGLFNVQYVVDGCNKKKVASTRFSIPSDADGASFMAFYTPLKFSDGYVDTMVPSAGLVSNLFINKYYGRQPYYIVAGPNYGRMNASGLVGPDYKYTMNELQIIEPFGVNCMVYRPSFGTFINANQTAKQIPVSALSKVNVRELVIYLQDEIEKVLQSYQWEFNNANTRAAILARANTICENVKANGGLQAYMNIMDESNNGPEIIDNEMAVLSTHIEPGMGCGKMVHELTIYRTGQMASSIK